MLTISNPGYLNPGFSFTSGRGLGTGLTLVQSMMPPKGARLAFRESADMVECELRLEAPVVRFQSPAHSPRGNGTISPQEHP